MIGDMSTGLAAATKALVKRSPPKANKVGKGEQGDPEPSFETHIGCERAETNRSRLVISRTRLGDVKPSQYWLFRV